MLKQECDFLVKQENERDDGEIVCSRETFKSVKPANCSLCDEKQATINMLQTEKKSLISMISTQKEENQHVTNEMEEAKLQSTKYLSENDKIKEENVHLASMVSGMESDNQRLTIELEEVNQKLKLISDENTKLKSEMEVLSLQVSSQYEVEKLVSHKKSKGQQCFLVRWKGFSSAHDSWVFQKDLMCPDMLEIYKKKHHLI